MESNNNECLTLKVLRLTKPYFTLENQIFLEENDLGFSEIYNNEKITKSSGIQLDNFLGLPTSFGNIYLGETFSCYITVINDGNQICRDIVIKTNLQTATQQLTLNSGTIKPSHELEPGQSLDDIICHEVKELGNHILICTVNYLIGSSMEKYFFKKFYKFMVSKPVDVKTKFFSEENSDVFMEAQIHNITNSSIFLERVSLEPTASYKVQEINSGNSLSLKATTTTLKPYSPSFYESCKPEKSFASNPYLNGNINCLKPNNTRQFLYQLTLRPDSGNIGNINQIGRLDIVWRTQMGERGRLQTSTLTKSSNIEQNSVYSDIKFTILQIPAESVVGKLFSIKCQLDNICERNLDLVLTLSNLSNQSGLLWSGCVKKSLGALISGSSLILDLQLIGTMPGLQTISGMKLTETFLRRDYDYNEIAQILIFNE